MQRQYIRQRERVFTEEMKVKLCKLVRKSYSLTEAAQGVGVTLRTVQRYRREEEDFDQEVRMAKLSKPDPLKLMESAARTHWRAAAWLLERTKPETYARKRGDLASGLKVTQALRLMMETALANTPEEARSELFKHLDKTYEHALDCCFPSLGPWDRPREPKMADTPLVFRERAKSAPVVHNYGLGTPDEWSFAAPQPTLAPGSSNRGPPRRPATLNNHKPIPNRPDRQFRTLMDPQLLHQPRLVVVDRALRKPQHLGALLHGATLGEQPHHLLFALRKNRDRTLIAGIVELVAPLRAADPRRERRIEHASTVQQHISHRRR
jgi:hypothetical protein